MSASGSAGSSGSVFLQFVIDGAWRRSVARAKGRHFLADGGEGSGGGRLPTRRVARRQERVRTLMTLELRSGGSDGRHH